MENEIKFVYRFSVFLNKKLKNELLKKIQIVTMVYTLFKNKFVSNPLRFSAVQSSHGHQESAV